MSRYDSPEETAERDERYMRWTKFGLKVCAWTVIGFVLLTVFFGLVSPQLNLYRANTEKRSAIAEAKARSDAAEYEAKRAVEIATAEAEADRVRADGIADANRTIADSLDPLYVQWYFVDRLDDVKGQIIYVPGEGYIPVTEAGRAVTPTTEKPK